MKRILFIIFFLSSLISFAQTDTSSVIAKKAETKPYKHSPKVATWLSVALPGAGQVYNRKNWWWKVPIIYGGGAALTYSIIFNNRNYNDFREAYKYRIQNGVEQNGNPRFDKFQTPTLRTIREGYRSSRDLAGICLFGLYALQIVDAAVEAHFFDFNVSDDLSLNVQPAINPYYNSWAGIQLTFKIK